MRSVASPTWIHDAWCAGGRPSSADMSRSSQTACGRSHGRCPSCKLYSASTDPRRMEDATTWEKDASFSHVLASSEVHRRTRRSCWSRVECLSTRRQEEALALARWSTRHCGELRKFFQQPSRSARATTQRGGPSRSTSVAQGSGVSWHPQPVALL